MKIYHYHPETGKYLGQGEADNDPLIEGNWLIPAHATNIAPPQSSEKQYTAFIDGDWRLIDFPQPVLEPEPEPAPPQDPEILRAAAYADLINGSDRLFMEALRKRAAGDKQGAIKAEQAGLDRVAEIQSTYPITNEVDLDG